MKSHPRYRLTLTIVLLTVLGSGAGQLEAQFREQSVLQVRSTTDPISNANVGVEFEITAALAEDSGITRPVIGAALGLPLGLLTGAALGYAIGPRDDVAPECMFVCVASGPLAGAVIGTAVGAGIGAHFLNKRRGNVWLTVASSVFGSIAGTGLGLLVGSGTDSELLGAAVAIPLAVGLPAVVEWATAN